jgi:hypothetical protein
MPVASNENGLNTVQLNQSDTDELFIVSNVEIPTNNLNMLGVEIYTVSAGYIQIGVIYHVLS